jgi:hypothetical protein
VLETGGVWVSVGIDEDEGEVPRDPVVEIVGADPELIGDPVTVGIEEVDPVDLIDPDHEGL